MTGPKKRKNNNENKKTKTRMIKFRIEVPSIKSPSAYLQKRYKSFYFNIVKLFLPDIHIATKDDSCIDESTLNIKQQPECDVILAR